MLHKIPNGILEIIEVFGNPNSSNFETNNIITFDLPYTLFYDKKPVNQARAHKLAVDNFIKGFKNVEDAGLAKQFVEFNGIYAKRNIRGRDRISLHSFGIAIDMEAFDITVGDVTAHQLGSTKRFPDKIVECFTSVGFFYGGDFKGRKDPMHFQLATGY